MAITGPRHQAVEEILPSNSIWLFGKLNRQLPWWLWSCLWVCHRVRLLMECLDSHPLFISLSFSYTFFGVKRPTLFHKANTALLKPNGFLHKPCCTSISIPFHGPYPLRKHKNRQAFWQQPHWHSISYPTCRENQKLNVLFSVLDIVSLYFHLFYLQ